MNLLLKNKYIHLSTSFVFLVFLYISIKSPLAGDDWGYAVNGSLYNPLFKAMEFYFTWSGRFFSELYGFLITPHKWVWNLLNPLLFSAIFYFTQKMINSKDKLLPNLVMLFLVLSVKDELRMETYTWLMGTTYVIPLAFSIIFLFVLLKTFYLDKPFNHYQRILSVFLLFWIGLSMENISSSILILNLVILIYSIIKTTQYKKDALLIFSTSLIAFVLLRLSPGASIRLIRDHQAWLDLSFLDQIILNYPNLIKMTFIEHRYLILTLSIISLVFYFQKIQDSSKKKIIISTVLIISLIYPFSLRIESLSFLNFLLPFLSIDSVFTYLFWPIYYLVILYILFINTDINDAKLLVPLLILASIANGVMLLSPIFGYRSSLFTVYYLISIIVFMTSQLRFHRAIYALLIIVLIGLIAQKLLVYKTKYDLVYDTHLIRSAEIAYYQDHPEVKDLWLIRYPIYTIHSGDVESWDTYHALVFKQYYDLSLDTTLNFYYPKEETAND